MVANRDASIETIAQAAREFKARKATVRESVGYWEGDRWIIPNGEVQICCARYLKKKERRDGKYDRLFANHLRRSVHLARRFGVDQWSILNCVWEEEVANYTQAKVKGLVEI